MPGLMGALAHFRHLGHVNDDVDVAAAGPTDAELREDMSFELREDGSFELRDGP